MALQGVFPPGTFGQLGLSGNWYGTLEWQYPPHQRQGAYEEEGRAINTLKVLTPPWRSMGSCGSAACMPAFTAGHVLIRQGRARCVALSHLLGPFSRQQARRAVPEHQRC